MFKFGSKRAGENPWTAWLQVDNEAPCPVIGPCSIGRAKTNTICISSEKVSRLHALVHQQEGGEHWLIDLGSSNGTYLNGRRVIQPFRLKEEDLIQIGEHRILFFHRVVDQAQQEAASAAEELTVREFQQSPCWFLVADIENFVALGGEMEADSLAKAVGEWFASCNDLVHEHQGTISQYLGDGFVAYWDGRKIPAGEILECLAAMKAKQEISALKFRLAVHFGKAGVSGSHIIGDNGLFGHDVNMTFRMEKLAKELSVPCIISEAAYEAFSQPTAARRLGAHEIRGIKGQHLFYQI